MELSQVTVPDGWFWYGLSLFLAGVIGWILFRYADKTEKLLQELTKIVGDHETRITVLESKNGKGKNTK